RQRLPRRHRRGRRRPRGRRLRGHRRPHHPGGRNMIERVVILSTGDELTTGRIVDTNANWLATTFFEIGVDVVAIVTVGDYPERLEWAWREALAHADLVVSTGGIGPTADDLTSETVARVLGRPLVEDVESVERIKR